MSEYKTEQEAINAGKARADEEGFINFDGQNCEDSWDEGLSCAGWDGYNSRCCCGNRRVYWETYQNKDGTWYASAVAW